MNAWKECREIGNATIYLGDVRDVLPELNIRDPDSAIITDPPYSSGGYQEAGKGSGSIGSTKEHSIAGDTLSTRGYLRLIRHTLQAIGASECYVFTDWRMWINTFDCVEEGGFRVRSMLVWNKEYGGMGVKWRSQHELICWGARGKLSPGWGAGNVITCKRSGNEHHPTEKPVPLMGELVRAADRTLVVDPFMGSASTGLAALQLGKRFVGVEVDPVHFEAATRRLEAYKDQGDIFRPAEQTGMDLSQPEEEPEQ